MSYIKIDSVEKLKELSAEQPLECFAWLNGGLRSSKTILWDDDKQVFGIINGIDNSSQRLTEQQLKTDSIINEAIEKGAFYSY